MHSWRTAMTAVAFTLTETTYHLEDSRVTVEERKTVIEDLKRFEHSYAYTFAFKQDSEGKEVLMHI